MSCELHDEMAETRPAIIHSREEADMELREIIALFTEEQPTELEVIDTSHGEDDFREAVIARWEKGALPPELGDRMVIKLAANGFTDSVRIGMWERLAEEYRKRGYYCPCFLRTRTGEYPRVAYKGRRCVVYGEEFSRYSPADKFGEKTLSAEGKFRYLDDLLRMNADIAAARLDFTDLPSAWCLFEVFDSLDAEDEVMENAREWLSCAERLPAAFQERVHIIWERWMENRAFLEKEYHRLPTSVFQADLNSTNVLLDGEGRFVGVMDFNLAGRETFLNYLFREVPFIFGRGGGAGASLADGSFSPTREILRRIIYAMSVVKERYRFSEAEKELALPLVRCLLPLWFTNVERLKAAKGEKEIQAALDDVELAQTMEIDFRACME